MTGSLSMKIRHRLRQCTLVLVLFCGSVFIPYAPRAEASDSSGTTQASGGYVGSRACAKCHASIYESFSRTSALKLVGNPYPSTKSRTQWINPAAFQLPAQYTFGTLGRDTLRSDSYKNLDLSIFRQFTITEQMHLEFRFEMFNATNTPVWAVPVTNFDAPNFGVVTSTANTARQLQFGLKLYY